MSGWKILAHSQNTLSEAKVRQKSKKSLSYILDEWYGKKIISRYFPFKTVPHLKSVKLGNLCALLNESGHLVLVAEQLMHNGAARLPLGDNCAQHCHTVHLCVLVKWRRLEKLTVKKVYTVIIKETGSPDGLRYCWHVPVLLDLSLNERRGWFLNFLGVPLWFVTEFKNISCGKCHHKLAYNVSCAI